jgi:hypothetical protein
VKDLDEYLIGLRSFAFPLKTRTMDLQGITEIEKTEFRKYLLTGNDAPKVEAQNTESDGRKLRGNQKGSGGSGGGSGEGSRGGSRGSGDSGRGNGGRGQGRGESHNHGQSRGSGDSNRGGHGEQKGRGESHNHGQSRGSGDSNRGGHGEQKGRGESHNHGQSRGSGDSNRGGHGEQKGRGEGHNHGKRDSRNGDRRSQRNEDSSRGGERRRGSDNDRNRNGASNRSNEQNKGRSSDQRPNNQPKGSRTEPRGKGPERSNRNSENRAPNPRPSRHPSPTQPSPRHLPVPLPKLPKIGAHTKILQKAVNNIAKSVQKIATKAAEAFQKGFVKLAEKHLKLLGKSMDRLANLEVKLSKLKLPDQQVTLESWSKEVRGPLLAKINKKLKGVMITKIGKGYKIVTTVSTTPKLDRSLRDYLTRRVAASFKRNPYEIKAEVKSGKVKNFIPISTYKDRIESFKPYTGISLAQYGSKYQHIKYTADIDNPGLDLVKVTALNVMKMKDGRYQHTAGYAWTFGSSVVTYRLERKRQCSRMSSSSSASPSSSSNTLKTSNGNAYGRQLIRNLMIGNAPSSTSSSVPTKLSLNSRNSATNPLGTNYATKTVSTTSTQAPTSSKIVTKTTTTTPSGAKVVSKVSTKVTPVTSTAAAAPKSSNQGNNSALKSTGNGSSSNKPSANNASNSQGNGSQGQDKLTGRERAAQVQQRNLDRQEARSNVPLGLQSMKVIIQKSLEARMAYLNQFIRTKLQTKTYNYQDMIDEDDSSIRDYKPFIDDSVVPGPGETCEYKDILVPNGFTPKEEGYVKKRLSTLAFRNIAVMLSISQRKLNNIYENTEAIDFKEYTDYETLEGVSEINIKTAIIKMLDGLTTESWTEADLKSKGSLTLKNEGREVAYIELKSTNVANVYDLTVLTGK